jgi:hypothetical protein
MLEFQGAKYVWNEAFWSCRMKDMFGTQHSGAPGSWICLEHYILELQGATYVWNKSFWSSKSFKMVGPKHSGAVGCDMVGTTYSAAPGL